MTVIFSIYSFISNSKKTELSIQANLQNSLIQCGNRNWNKTITRPSTSRIRIQIHRDRKKSGPHLGYCIAQNGNNYYLILCILLFFQYSMNSFIKCKNQNWNQFITTGFREDICCPNGLKEQWRWFSPFFISNSFCRKTELSIQANLEKTEFCLWTEEF